MAPDTNADVLRRHGLTILADWAENALIAPQYARQSAYWASVLCEPEIPEFAEWPMEGARGFEFEADNANPRVWPRNSDHCCNSDH